jgi:uncharacterized membrane protein HdeD (DUF308 family)
MIFYYMDKSRKDIDYKNLHFLGMILTFIGIIITITSRNSAFLPVMAFGIILMINGLAKLEKWYGKY